MTIWLQIVLTDFSVSIRHRTYVTCDTEKYTSYVPKIWQLGIFNMQSCFSWYLFKNLTVRCFEQLNPLTFLAELKSLWNNFEVCKKNSRHSPIKPTQQCSHCVNSALSNIKYKSWFDLSPADVGQDGFPTRMNRGLWCHKKSNIKISSSNMNERSKIDSAVWCSWILDITSSEMFLKLAFYLWMPPLPITIT